MFLTRFIRCDGKADEEYFYTAIEEARYHLELFRNDDSELYKRIEVASEDKPDEAIEALSFTY